MAATEVDLQITTTSRSMSGPPWPTAEFPAISMNGNAFPQPGNPPTDPSGYQVVVIDLAQDITSPQSIITNEYVSLWDEGGGWPATYPAMYNLVVQAILTSGNVGMQLVFVVSYGMDNNAPPTSFALQTFLDYGAGAGVQNWVTHCEPGSMGGEWVSQPMNYILVGTSGAAYSQGFEIYDNSANDPITTTLKATLQNNVPPSSP